MKLLYYLNPFLNLNIITYHNTSTVSLIHADTKRLQSYTSRLISPSAVWITQLNTTFLNTHISANLQAVEEATPGPFPETNSLLFYCSLAAQWPSLSHEHKHWLWKSISHFIVVFSIDCCSCSVLGFIFVLSFFLVIFCVFDKVTLTASRGKIFYH